ncbi:AAA family ATPase [Brucella endophytica]|uniref:AAA family ATPase n=1 Tax=Brucella endophytica TaxID=1963359 RepID=UPI001664B6A6
MQQSVPAIFITGSSHVGKTTLAARLADRLSWNLISTDKLARHPGRPWPDIPPAVAEYYASLSPETIYWFLRVHHENMWPLIRQKIEAKTRARRPFIMEGSALRPEYIAALGGIAVCLWADEDFLRERIRREARYVEANAYQRVLIDKFTERSVRDNSEMRASAEKHSMTIVDTADAGAVERLFDMLVERANA